MTTQCLDKRETEFFEAVYALMKNQYPEMEERYGMWRVHQHFDLQEDEVLHETSNSQIKESTLKIIKKKDLPNKAFASTWKLTDSGPIVATWCCDDQPIP